jgi:hypothetical protein
VNTEVKVFSVEPEASGINDSTPGTLTTEGTVRLPEGIQPLEIPPAVAAIVNTFLGPAKLLSK